MPELLKGLTLLMLPGPILGVLLLFGWLLLRSEISAPAASGLLANRFCWRCLQTSRRLMKTCSVFHRRPCDKSGGIASDPHSDRRPLPGHTRIAAVNYHPRNCSRPCGPFEKQPALLLRL